MFGWRKKDKDKEKNSKDSKKVQFNSGVLNDKEKSFPLGKSEDYSDDIIRSKTMNPENSEFEVWRAVDNKNNKKNNDLVLTEYLEKSKNDEENILKNKTKLEHPSIKDRINIIENYITKETQNTNHNIDEDYSDNSDQEIEKSIHKKREDENDDDDDEEERFSQIRNKSRSKKVINKKIIEIDDVNKCEYPDFNAECEFIGENKEKYHVKILIDTSFNIVFSPEMKNNFKAFNLNYYQFPLLAIKNYIPTKKKKNML